MVKIKSLAGLRDYRQRAGMTQGELAKICNVSRVSVNNWETGRGWPSAAILPMLADVLLCSIDDLYDHITDGGECPWPEDVARSTTDTGELPV